MVGMVGLGVIRGATCKLATLDLIGDMFLLLY